MKKTARKFKQLAAVLIAMQLFILWNISTVAAEEKTFKVIEDKSHYSYPNTVYNLGEPYAPEAAHLFGYWLEGGSTTDYGGNLRAFLKLALLNNIVDNLLNKNQGPQIRSLIM